MADTNEMTLEEIRSRGLAALMRELGPVGYVRFMQQFDRGKGDYTAERQQWLDALSPEQLKALVSAKQ
jgi:hypothetical protein